jgi:hypothetical protein
MPQASKYTENTELQETEIDAAGIKTQRMHGKERLESHQKRPGKLESVSFVSWI